MWLHFYHIIRCGTNMYRSIIVVCITMASPVCSSLSCILHDDVIKWKHFPHYWPFVSPVTSPHKGQWPEALMCSLICAWINGSVNNRKAGDLRWHLAHYDVTVMQSNAASRLPHQQSHLAIQTDMLANMLATWNHVEQEINLLSDFHCLVIKLQLACHFMGNQELWKPMLIFNEIEIGAGDTE